LERAEYKNEQDQPDGQDQPEKEPWGHHDSESSTRPILLGCLQSLEK
jgi:hypothetical protein